MKTEFHCCSDLGHGFGLGTDATAEGWSNLTLQFWKRQIKMNRNARTDDMPARVFFLPFWAKDSKIILK